MILVWLSVFFLFEGYCDIELGRIGEAVFNVLFMFY